jgi:CheY-like chemotaxis protein
MLMQKQIIQSSRILIVDDQPQNVLLLERTLQGAGYRYLASVTDSRNVLQTFTEFHPDLVAMDLRMPHVDGFELLKQLRSRVPAGKFVPVLVLTADNTRWLWVRKPSSRNQST